MGGHETPPWLEGWQPADAKPKPKIGNPTWTPGMRSPNPAGRPRGIIDKRVRVAQRMLDDADSIVSAIIEKAQEGDVGAAALILGRVLPNLRSQAEKVQFDFDATASIPQQIEAVLTAIAAGAVAPDVGQTIISALGTLSSARVADDLEARLITLEMRSV
ncbi:hypothetical protein M0208_01455 [Sphingomonas sp. SUN019]|uniref:hypothetical protein n=1 Tax=Sphingomonas sp. SUN019 TaxID=2937788 RepID=UPI002164A2B3|nr:hypothetical protein [Sphingomonas sp. SUN019]UVO49247.1 hypothetical protein M0208_01455 [Sphingomonas sp. SUN019]